MLASIRISAMARLNSTNTMRPGYVLVRRVYELVHASDPE
ncbi:unannotated protein [freshwater metagenome]|uniref:Unannotated protein n=1 Tax=freshwater metagenome TaxID=449393 RepID=A0A6J7GJR7_9ZZZZ